MEKAISKWSYGVVLTGGSNISELSERIAREATSSGTSSFIISGRFGSGKSRILESVATSLSSSGYEVFFPPPLTSPETLKYDPFNRILDSITGTNKVRELSEILLDLENLWKSGRKMAIILEGLNLLGDPTRYLFTYLASNTGVSGMILAGSLDTDMFLWNGDVAGFLETHRTEGISRIYETGKPAITDFTGFLESRGYSLDYDLVRDLYRLADGNFRILDYTLRYYKHKGIINASGGVNNSLYRSFLIPANMGQFISLILDEASDAEREIIALLSLCETGLDLRLMASLTGMTADETKQAIETLKSKGLLTLNMGTASFTSYFLKRYASDRLSASVQESAAQRISASAEFVNLPLQSRINILTVSRSYEDLSNLIRNEWRSFVRKFTSVSELRRFSESMMGKFADEETNSILGLVRCNAIYNSDDLEGARSCYEHLGNNNIDRVSTSLTLATIYSALGNHEASVSVLDSLLAKKDLDSGASAMAHIILAENYFSLDQIQRSKEHADAALQLALKDKNHEAEARALTVLGSISGYTGDYEGALGLYEKSLKINMKLGIWLQITRNMNNIQAVLEYLGRYPQAMDTGLALIPYTYLTGDRTMRSAGMLNLAYVMDIIGEAKKARQLAAVSLAISERMSNHMQAFRASLLAYLASMKAFDFDSSVSYAEKCLEITSSLGTRGTKEFSIAIRHMARYFGGKVMDKADEELLTADYSLDPRDGIQFSFLVSLYFMIRGDLYRAGDAFNRALDAATETQEPYFLDAGLALSALNLYFTSDFRGLEKMVEREAESHSAFLRSVLLGCRLVVERRKDGNLRDLWIEGENFMEKSATRAFGSIPLSMLLHNVIQEGGAEELRTLPLQHFLKSIPPPMSSYFRIRIIDRGLSA